MEKERREQKERKHDRVEESSWGVSELSITTENWMLSPKRPVKSGMEMRWFCFLQQTNTLSVWTEVSDWNRFMMGVRLMGVRWNKGKNENDVDAETKTQETMQRWFKASVLFRWGERSCHYLQLSLLFIVCERKMPIKGALNTGKGARAVKTSLNATVPTWNWASEPLCTSWL